MSTDNVNTPSTPPTKKRKYESGTDNNATPKDSRQPDDTQMRDDNSSPKKELKFDDTDIDESHKTEKKFTEKSIIVENNFIDNNILVLDNGIQYTPGCISLDSIIMILLQVVLPDCEFIQVAGARVNIEDESKNLCNIVAKMKVANNTDTRNNLITLLSLIDTAHDFTKYRTSLTIAQIHNILTINVKYILQYINDTELKDNYQSFLNLLLRTNNIVNNPKFKKPVILKILEIAELPHYTRDVIQEKITTLGTYLFELLGIAPDTNFNYIKSRYYIFYLLHSFIFAKIHIDKKAQILKIVNNILSKMLISHITDFITDFDYILAKLTISGNENDITKTWYIKKNTNNTFTITCQLSSQDVSYTDIVTYPSLWIHDMATSFEDRADYITVSNCFKPLIDQARVSMRPGAINVKKLPENSASIIKLKNRKYIEHRLECKADIECKLTTTALLPIDNDCKLIIKLPEPFSGSLPDRNSVSKIANELKVIDININNNDKSKFVYALCALKRAGDWIQCNISKSLNIGLQTKDIWCSVYLALIGGCMHYNGNIYNYLYKSPYDISGSDDRLKYLDNVFNKYMKYKTKYTQLKNKLLLFL